MSTKPRKLRDWSISAKLRLLITSACILVIGLTCTAFVVAEWFAFKSGLLESLTVRAQILAFNAAAPLAFSSPSDAEALLDALKADPNTTACVIYDAKGKIFAHFQRLASTPVPAVEVGGHLFDGRNLTVRAPIEFNSRPLGSLVLEQGLARLYQRMALYIGMAMGFMALSSLLAYILAGRFQREVSAPILDLTKSAHAVADGRDYSIRARKVGEDEIGYLTDAFNTMLTRIQDHERLLEAAVAERTAELTAANNELESFSFSVSHDLRAPLRAILGMAEIIAEDHGDELPKPVQTHLASIRRHGLRMTQLITDMLEFARKSRREPVLEQIDCDAIVASVISDFREEIDSRGVELTIDVLPPCRADPSLLRQVLVNLVSNALKYSRGRSPARITVGTVPVEHPGQVGYFIKDNGVGFDMEQAKRLFEPFERFHPADKFEGTGVGLALAHRVIKRHGGRMWAEATPDAGATFYFSLATGVSA